MLRGASKLAVAGLGALALALALTANASAAAPSPRVKEAGTRHYIDDGRGNELLLRGINANALVHYPSYFRQTVPLQRSDLREMSALGFNFLRLPISWSRLEPAPDRFSTSYLKEISTITKQAEAEGMRVLIDFHQDRYNRTLRPTDEADGAPNWATVTDGQPCAAGPFTSPCSVAAYDHFWNNDVVAGKPLQRHYLEALLKVSRHLRDDKGLLGIELMNEPTFGSTSSPAFERDQLWPFNRKMINGLRRDGEKRMIWFGPNLLRDVIDVDPGNPERFSDDDNLVYAPHIYTGTFNGGDSAQLQGSYAAAEQEAQAYGAALVNGEWGGGSDAKAERLRGEQLDLQDQYAIGGGFWMWKQKPGFYNWQTVEPNGALRTDSMRAQQLSRPHVDSVPGRLLSTGIDAGNLKATVRGDGGTARFWSGTIVLRGAQSTITKPRVRAYVDGKRVRPTKSKVKFRGGGTSLLGYRVGVTVPAGRHQIELRPGALRTSG